MLNIAIIEDEKKIADSLSSIIKNSAPDCNIVAYADSIESGLRLFATYKVDFAFFDVELKDGLSFKILEQLPSIDFRIVFVTAHSHYAINAFEYSALDYIVKPIHVDCVLRAITRAKKACQDKQATSNISFLLDNLNQSKENQKIILQTAETNHYVQLKEIVRCESENNYCNIILNSGEKILVSKPLKEYEKLLPCKCFFRVHQSHLINLNYIKQIKKRLYKIILSNGDKVPLASRRKEELTEKMKEFF